ncbi:MAG: YitT family protein [Epulopiscium sp.]|nr:YitT family protein [Candidatus Epulonipiscium sp.]
MKGNTMSKNKKQELIREYLYIILGTTLLAIAINVFFARQGLVTGGVTGLAIIVQELTKGVWDGGIPLWITNIAINIPLFLIAISLKGKMFGTKTLFSTLYLSLSLYLTQGIVSLTQDFLLSSIFGGVLGGIGIGLVFAGFATTGGTDLAASILHLYFAHVSVGTLMFIIDAVIIGIGFFVFGPEKTMYAIIAVYITAKMMDGILEGIHFSKAAFIISENSTAIATALMNTLDRGVTALSGRGMYTQQSKDVLLCVVSKKQIAKLKDIVKEVDENAFVIVADVREVVGEGFIQYKK